jgi:hypothetical protein
MGYVYKVIHISSWNYEIFTVPDHHFFDEIRVIRVPQRSHEALRRLLIIMRLNNVTEFYMAK